MNNNRNKTKKGKKRAGGKHALTGRKRFLIIVGSPFFLFFVLDHFHKGRKMICEIREREEDGRKCVRLDDAHEKGKPSKVRGSGSNRLVRWRPTEREVGRERKIFSDCVSRCNASIRDDVK